MRTNIIFAKEDVREEPPQLGSDVPQEEVFSLREDIREGLAKANVINKDTDDINDAIGDIGAAMRVQDIIASQESLSLSAIKTCRITMEHLRKKLKLGDQFIMPAMECFENPHEAVQARSVSLEGITDVIVSIWRAIKKAFLTVWQKIKTFLHNIFGVFPRLKKYVESLKKRVDETRHLPKQDRFVDEETLKAFSIDGRFSSVNVNSILNAHIQITSGMSRLTASVNSVITNLEAGHKALVDKLTDIKKEIDTSPDKEADKGIVDKNINELNKVFREYAIPSAITTGLIESLNLSNSRINERDVLGVSNDHFIDNKVIVIIKNDLPESAEGQAVYELEVDIRTLNDTVAKELSVLSGGEMKSILADCERLIAMAENIKSYTDKLDNFSKRMTNLFDGIEKTVEQAGRDPLYSPSMSEFNKVLQNIRIPVNSLISIFNRIYTTVPSFNISAVQKATRYVDLSLSYY